MIIDCKHLMDLLHIHTNAFKVCESQMLTKKKEATRLNCTTNDKLMKQMILKN